MALSSEQKKILNDAIKAYRFPPALFDFAKKRAVCLPNMKAVEKQIREDLVSGNPRRVKNGLSNVIFWGWAQREGRQKYWVNRFRQTVTPKQVRACTNLFSTRRPPTLQEIKCLNLPSFSGMSFISKIRMFLDPRRSATLDMQLAKLRCVRPRTILSGLKMPTKQIRITDHNEQIYDDWCKILVQISKAYFEGRYNAADVERGFFHLVQCGSLKQAATILHYADS